MAGIVALARGSNYCCAAGDQADAYRLVGAWSAHALRCSACVAVRRPALLISERFCCPADFVHEESYVIGEITGTCGGLSCEADFMPAVGRLALLGADARRELGTRSADRLFSSAECSGLCGTGGAGDANGLQLRLPVGVFLLGLCHMIC
jgi:hypothetical protein